MKLNLLLLSQFLTPKIKSCSYVIFSIFWNPILESSQELGTENQSRLDFDSTRRDKHLYPLESKKRKFFVLLIKQLIN